MQTIWSRAIQAKSSCRCPTCLPNPSSIARRPNTAAASQKVRYGDIATFFYSSILATAAVADAERKDAKRKKLDKSIVEAVEALKAVELEQHKRLQILHSAQYELRVVEEQRERRIEALRKTMGKSCVAQQADSPHNTMEKSEKKQLRLRGALEAAGQTLSGAKHKFRTTKMMVQSGLKPEYSGNIDSSSEHKNDSVAVPVEVSRRIEGTPGTGGRTRMPSYRRVQLSNTDDVNLLPGSARGPKLISPGSSTKVSSIGAAHHKLHRRKHILLKEGVIEKSKDTSGRSPYKLTSLARSASKWLSYNQSSMDFTKGQNSDRLWSSPSRKTPSSDHKILVMNTSVAKLIYRLLLISLDGADADGVVLNISHTPWILKPQHRPELHIRVLDMNERLAKLRKTVSDTHTIEPIPFPRYSNHADCQLDKDFLHKALQCSLAGRSSITDLLPKICYDLLISETPPSIHSYNMLILRLCYLQYYRVASAVIDSLFECKLRPNEITTAAILNFYSNTNDLDAFRGYINQMNAERNHGLIVASISTKITPENKNHFVILSEKDFSYRLRRRSRLFKCGKLLRDVMYIEKAPRNRDTYVALICGWLSFSDLRSAFREYVTMILSGWEADQTILNALLSYCALRGRWYWGCAIWREIVKTCKRPDPIAYHWMLHLCARREKSEMFDMVLQHGAVHQILPTDIRIEAFVMPTESMASYNRLLEMLQEHIQIPGLPPLTKRNRKVTEHTPSNLSSILSGSLEDADFDRLARAREHMANLNAVDVGSFEHTDTKYRPLVIVPYRYTGQKSPPSSSRSLGGKSRIQSVSLTQRLAVRRNVVSAQLSHVPLEHYPEDKASQIPKPATPQRKAPCISRRTARRAARLAAGERARQKALSLAPSGTKIENTIEIEDAIADHPRTESRFLPSISSVAVREIPRQMQECSNDNGISQANVPISHCPTATSESPEPMMAASTNVDTRTQAPTIIARAATPEVLETSYVTLAKSETVQAGVIFTASSAATHTRSERMTTAFTKSEECQLAKPFNDPSVALRGLPRETKIVARQRAKPQADVPFALSSSGTDGLSSTNASQPPQFSVRSVGYNPSYYVLNISRETQASTSAEVQ